MLSHTVVPGPRMAFAWDKGHVEEMVHFGKWITVSSIASFIVSQSDVILFGLLLPSSFLGIYFLAKTLIDTAEGLLERLNGALTLPVLGEVLRINPDNLQRPLLSLSASHRPSGGRGRRILFLSPPTRSSASSTMRGMRRPGPMLRLLALGLAIYPFQLIRSAIHRGRKYSYGRNRHHHAGRIADSILASVLSRWPAGRHRWRSRSAAWFHRRLFYSRRTAENG